MRTIKIISYVIAMSLIAGIAITCNKDDDTPPSKAEKMNLTIGKLPLTLKMGDKITLKASDKAGTFIWETTNTEVVTVDDKGTITAVAVGEAVITAKSSSDRGQIQVRWQVTVKEQSPEKTPETEVQTPTKAAMTSEGILMLKLQVGQTADISVEVEDSGREVTYSSSSEKIAAIDDKGTLTAVAVGEAEITITTKKGMTQRLKVIVSGEKDEIITRIIKDFYAPVDHKHPEDWEKQLQPSNIDYYTKFDFSTGKEVDKDSDDWDIAFAGAFIIVNGGKKMSDKEPERTGNAAAAILSKITFEGVTEVKEVQWKQDASSVYAISDDMISTTKGWCYYDMSKHLIHPISRRILVFRTRDGKYAKMQILSFYKGMVDQEKIPAMSHNFNYYTLKYAYNKKGGTTIGKLSESKEACIAPKEVSKKPAVSTPKRASINVPGNLIENGGFEQEIKTAWEFNQEAFEITDADAHSGEKSIHFYTPIARSSLESKAFKLSPGYYRALFYVKGMEHLGQVQLSISYDSKKGTHGGMLADPLKEEAEYGWHGYKRDFQVKTSQEDYTWKIVFSPKVYDDTKPISIYFDDVSLVRLTKVHFAQRVRLVNEKGNEKPIEVKLTLEYPAAQDTKVKIYSKGKYPGLYFEGSSYVTFKKGYREASFKLKIINDKMYTGNREYSFTISNQGESSIVVDTKDFILQVKDDEKALPEKLVTIPDDHFRAYLKDKFPGSFPNGGNQMNANHAMVITTEKLYPRSQNIKSLEGIQYFTHLTLLSCGNNQLKSLDVSGNTLLQNLFCEYNQLKELKVEKNKALVNLRCRNNQLENLDVSKCQLRYLTIEGNPLKSIKVNIHSLDSEYLKGKLIQAKSKNPQLMISTYDNSGKVSCKDYNPSDGFCKSTSSAKKASGGVSTPVATSEKTLSIQSKSFTFTAYKFFDRKDRKGVQGHFTDIQTDALHNPSNSITEALKGITFKIAVASLETGDLERNSNVIMYYFKKMTETEFITGSFGTFNESTHKGTITITMNGKTNDMPVDFKIENNTLSFNGTVNTGKWSALGAFEALTKICKVVHSKTGDPKYAKTWPDVDIKGNITFSE